MSWYADLHLNQIFDQIGAWNALSAKNRRPESASWYSKKSTSNLEVDPPGGVEKKKGTSIRKYNWRKWIWRQKLFGDRSKVGLVFFYDWNHKSQLEIIELSIIMCKIKNGIWVKVEIMNLETEIIWRQVQNGSNLDRIIFLGCCNHLHQLNIIIF